MSKLTDELEVLALAATSAVLLAGALASAAVKAAARRLLTRT